MNNNHNHKTTFLLGAGASFGHILDNSKTPPIMKKFLSSSAKRGILNEAEFPDLVSYIKKFSPKADLLEACQSIESNSDLEEFLGSINDTWVLHLGLHYVCRYLGIFCKKELSRDSAYMELARYIQSQKTEVGGVINLNYDILFDQALDECKINVNHGLTKSSPSNLPYMKPHGSLNFIFPYDRFIKMPCKNWEEYVKKKNSTILGNQFSGRPVEMYKPTFVFETDFLGGGVLKNIPVIVMPLGKNKNYDQFDSYFSIWETIKKILEDTSKLAVIGCALNEEDEMLWKCLNQHLNKMATVKVVSRNKEDAELVVKKFRNHSFSNVSPVDVCGFYQYAKEFLSNGKT